MNINFFKSIHHVAIICSDYQKSKDFYTKILGFKIVREVYRDERDSYKLDLEICENQYIELFSFPNPPCRVSRPEACGLRHLAFEVDDVVEAHKDLLTKNLEVEDVRIDEFTNRKFFFFSDPDELPIEVYESQTILFNF